MDLERLTNRIIAHEGFRSFAYKDTLGNYTIGYGHLITQDQAEHVYNMGLNAAEAYSILEEDINKAAFQAKDTFSWFLDLNDIRQEIIVEMIFQLGIHGVSQFHHMIEAIVRRDWALAADEMLNSEWQKQTPSRAAELANLMLNGCDD